MPNVVTGGRFERLAAVGSRVLPWIAMVLVVVGARLWLIERYGGALPVHDQWTAEGALLLKPFVEGRLHLSDLFIPNNEHRIVPTKLLALALFYLNGQWDSRVEMVANTLLCALIAALAVKGLLTLTGNTQRPAVFVGVTMWLALPYAQENTLWGFQSAFYFLLLFSLIAMWGLATRRVWSGGWWTGAVCAIIACFTMGSGMLAAVAVAMMSVLGLLTARTRLREQLPTLAVCFAAGAIAAVSRPVVPYHEAFGAASPVAWLVMFAKCLAWPFCNYAALSLLTWLPVALLVSYYWRRRRESLFTTQKPVVELLLVIGFWVGLQSAAIAYARAGHDPHVVSRYMDILAVGAVANLLALVLLLNYTRPGRVYYAGAIGWCAVLLAGASLLSYSEARSQEGRPPYLRNADRTVRAYLATGDRSLLGGPPDALPVPYPDGEYIGELLDDPTIRDILPASARASIQLAPAVVTGSAFSTETAHVVGNSRAPEIGRGAFTAIEAPAIGTFRSAPFKSRQPYLEFEIAGFMNNGMRFSLVDDDAHRARPIIPGQWLDDTLRVARMPANRGAYVVDAIDQSAAGWFGFSGPREMGALSFYAISLYRKGRHLLIIGVALALSNLVYHAVAGRLRDHRPGVA